MFKVLFFWLKYHFLNWIGRPMGTKVVRVAGYRFQIQRLDPNELLNEILEAFPNADEALNPDNMEQTELAARALHKRVFLDSVIWPALCRTELNSGKYVPVDRILNDPQITVGLFDEIVEFNLGKEFLKKGYEVLAEKGFR